jgi:putative transcriptional regulator
MATSNAFKEIMEGLKFMRAHALGETTEGRTTPGRIEEIDVVKVRQKTGLSQGEFATVFGFSSATLKNWEQRRNPPAGAARVLLTLIDRDPETILRTLRATPAKKAKAVGRPGAQKARAAARG